MLLCIFKTCTEWRSAGLQPTSAKGPHRERSYQSAGRCRFRVVGVGATASSGVSVAGGLGGVLFTFASDGAGNVLPPLSTKGARGWLSGPRHAGGGMSLGRTVGAGGCTIVVP